MKSVWNALGMPIRRIFSSKTHVVIHCNATEKTRINRSASVQMYTAQFRNKDPLHCEPKMYIETKVEHDATIYILGSFR